MPPCILDEFQFFIWDFDGTLFRLDVDWQGLRRRLQGMLQGHSADTPTPAATIDGMLAAARRAGLQEAVHAAITDAELAGLADWQAGLRSGPTAHLAQRAHASAIVSNNMSGTIEAFLRSVGLPQIPFRTRDLVIRPKPAQDGLDDLRSLWEGRPTVVIGDSEIDARLAADAGLHFIHVDDLDGLSCASS